MKKYLLTVNVGRTKRKIDIVYSEEFPNLGVGQAIMNRLLKSAGYKIINV